LKRKERLETRVNPHFQKIKLFLLKNNFLYVLDRFDTLISKIIFKNKKKHHFDAFRHEKHFEKQPQPHSQKITNRALRNSVKKTSKNCFIKTAFQTQFFSGSCSTKRNLICYQTLCCVCYTANTKTVTKQTQPRPN
jgi:hypothetical protein